jgi:hypothetical protein
MKRKGQLEYVGWIIYWHLNGNQTTFEIQNTDLNSTEDKKEPPCCKATVISSDKWINMFE